MATRLDNLKVPTSEQARENGRKGGIRSAQVKKEKKRATEAAKIMMSMPIVGKSHDKLIELKEKELKLKEREIRLKEEALKKEMASDDKVTIINDLLYEDDKDQ